jgi:hypothetical protein
MRILTRKTTTTTRRRKKKALLMMRRNYQYLVHLLLLQLQTHALAPSWCIFEDAITRAK